jgi:hypothetical protein
VLKYSRHNNHRENEMNDVMLAAIRSEIQQAQQPLLEKIDEVDAWATSVFYALNQILPVLLRDHPKAEQIQQILQRRDDRYEELLENPERAGEGESAELYEVCKMLNRQMAQLGVWPNVDPSEASQKTLERALRRRNR